MLVLIAGAAVSLGWPTRHGAFLSGDDQRFVVEQVFVNHPSLAHAAKLLTIIHGDLYQPLPMLSFQANYALAQADPASRFGVRPFVFHLTNIALHAINALLACAVAYQLSRCRPIALLTGLMFACHPLAMEPVAWISGRMILLATTFSLLIILICLTRRSDGGGAGQWGIATATWIFALASKVLPSVPLAAALCDYHRHGRLPRRTWITYATLLVLTAAAAWLALHATSGFGMIESTAAESTTSAPVRILLAARGYLESYIWPSRLAAWSPPPDHERFWSAEVGIAVAEYAALTVLAVIAWRRNRLAFVGVALFVLLLAPFLAASVARRLLTADRYMYLPMLGLHLALAAVLVQIKDLYSRRVGPRTGVVVVCVAITGLLAAWLTTGWKYASCWADSVARDLRVVEVYPERVEARVELARAHIFQHASEAALAAIAEARRQWPEDARLAAEAGEAYRLKEDWPAALKELAYAVEQMPLRPRTRYHYALTLEQLGRTDEARDGYRKILELSPGFLPAATALARSHRAAGDLDEAIRAYKRAVEINPFHRDALFELALLHMQRQEWALAELRLQAILDLDARDLPALLNLGVAYSREGRGESALATWDRLLSFDPTVSAARINMAGLLVSLGRPAEAERQYEAVLSEDHKNMSAAVGLHELFWRQKRFDELVDLWSCRVEIRDPPDTANAWLVWAYALAGRTESANEAATRIPGDSPLRSFANWALAFDALRRGDDVELRSRLGSPSMISEFSPTRHEEARMILTALAELPAERRESVGGTYVLARALLFDGNLAAAGIVVDRLLTLSKGTAWAEDVRTLVDLLKRSG